MKIFVIILNWNGKQDTLQCLESWQRVKTAHQIIVVDNGSTDDSVAAVQRSFPKVQVTETGKNLGYAEGNNVGIRIALDQLADFILILNNDTTVSPGILDAFLERDIPLQGGKALQKDTSDRLDHLGGKWNPDKANFDMVGHHDLASKWTEPIVLDYVCGVAIFAHSRVFREVGLFDPRFFLFWEECDWCSRAIKAGYRPTVCPTAILHHSGSASFVGGSPHTIYYWSRNRLLWIERNCSTEDHLQFMKMIKKEHYRLLWLYIVKKMQLLFYEKTRERIERLRAYRAELQGYRDYQRKRFGIGPAWLTEKSLL